MNSTVYNIALGGGIFAALAFNHLFIDWFFQNHNEAIKKHDHPWIRAKHCLVYTIGFFPIMWLLNFQAWELVVGMNILFLVTSYRRFLCADLPLGKVYS